MIHNNKKEIELTLEPRANIALYRQIVDEVKQHVAANRLKAGDKMPTVRELSRKLGVNPATVARAYQELEQEGILGASRRRGTIVMGVSDSPQRLPLRQSRLSGILSDIILNVLSQGYSPEEIEAAFGLQLARWRIQRETPGPQPGHNVPDSSNTLRIVGSNDLALDLLVSRLKYKNPEITVQMTPAGSLGGLLAIQQGKADMAGIHLLDEETGQYNYPYIKHTLPNMPVAVVHLADRIQGLMVAKGNPLQILDLQDLRRSNIRFANRQKGSGTRVWLDYKLREMGLDPATIKGYELELDTHLAVAMSIARGEADVGLGIQAAAHSSGLDFIPMTQERFDLVIPRDNYLSPLFAPLREIIASQEFKNVVNEMGGYDIAETGATVLVK